jgi:hypothetical protein
MVARIGYRREDSFPPVRPPVGPGRRPDRAGMARVGGPPGGGAGRNG